MYVYVHAVDTRAFGLCSDSDGQWGADRKRTTRRTLRSSCRGGPVSVAAAAAPSVRAPSHDGASTDGAVAAPTVVRARQRGHRRMAMHIASNAAPFDLPKRRLGASELERPPRLGWTASWSTGFVGKYLNSFYYRNTIYIRNILRRSN